MAQKKILIIDDDREICDYVEELLSFRLTVLKAPDSDSGLKLIREQSPALVLLDVRLQSQNGLDICKLLRETPETKHIPILMYSGSDDADQRAEAFDRGADDYIVKTARPRELIARILSKIRRLEERPDDGGIEGEPESISCGNLTLHLNRLEATVNGQPLALSVLEFNLLRFFLANKNRVVSREAILKGVWQDSVVSNRTIDTHMVYLRKKLDGFDHVLGTVYGAGYILRDKPTAGDPAP